MTLYRFTCPKCGNHVVNEVTVDIVEYKSFEYMDEFANIVNYINTDVDYTNSDTSEFECTKCGELLGYDEKELFEDNFTEVEAG